MARAMNTTRATRFKACTLTMPVVAHIPLGIRNYSLRIVERTHIMIEVEKAFNPSSHIIQISSSQGKKDYLPVQWRLVWFRSLCPDGKITTELLDLDRKEECEHETSVWNDEKRKYEKVIKHAKGVAVFKATEIGRASC